MTCGIATFKPGQQVSEHQHETMYEVYVLLSGKAEFTINHKKFVVSAQEAVIIEPGEIHAQHNPFDHDVSRLYFGISTDQ